MSGNVVASPHHATGRLHVVVFDIAGEDSGGSKVRYLRFAARHGE